MNELTLEWTEAGQVHHQTIHEQQPSKHPGTVRMGRDPTRCDVVLNDPTVSGLHIEIFFDPQQHCFQVRNLRDSNPPLVDGQRLLDGEMALTEGSTLYLGQLELKVVAVISAKSAVAPTILVPPRSEPQPSAPAAHVHQVPGPTAKADAAYGLMCPKCHQISGYERLEQGCPWCGTSLAAAISVLIAPQHKQA